ncbi:Nif3-like dinuclear metal center hexameric protein [Melioribacteraceae bacterium 4301-Me]|uniref:Nif3-like dinuclear metal center hexameric protein n=1 Tax=Pyranulibacter aquaticus TaxID=3163344 RepID=UPI003594DA82
MAKYLEKWAPPGAAWDKDNVGLQVGSKNAKLKNIMLCLELNNEVLQEAINKKCNFIFTHHPLIFLPLKKINIQDDPTSKLIESIIINNITVYSAHTNLDFTKDGVSFALAKKLKLKNIDFLENQEANQFKVAVFVPLDKAEEVAYAAFNAGAGTIGEYDNCSFRSKGIGTFKGSAKSNPTIGKKNTYEKVDELKLEFIVDSWNLNAVISAVLNAHPYEEPAYDVYLLKNKNVNYGMGAIGQLEKELTVDEFLDYVAINLKLKSFRYCSNKNKKIKKVAVCGGSGSDLLAAAINAQADSFITADIKYHVFQKAEGKILLIDAGHYETEIFSLDAVKKKIESFLGNNKSISVFKFSGTTNPIKYY